jgi:hypothetical protein
MNKYAAFDHLIEGVQVIDSDWRYVYVNDVVANHGKAPKDTYIGCTMMEKYQGIEHTEMFAQLRQCMESKSSGTIHQSTLSILTAVRVGLS